MNDEFHRKALAVVVLISSVVIFLDSFFWSIP